MKRFWRSAGVAILCSGLISCSENSNSSTAQVGQSESASANSASADSASIQQAAGAQVSADANAGVTQVVLPVDATSTPHDVVLAFLNAMRDGNGQITAALLTTKAQEETVKHDWPVQPRAPTAKYQLGPARYADGGQTAVCVPCVWTESDDQSGQTRFEVEWRMHREETGWRVAGFASEIVPGRGPSYFNFEDIGNLKETQSAVEAALAESDPAVGSQPVARQPSSDSAFR